MTLPAGSGRIWNLDLEDFENSIRSSLQGVCFVGSFRRNFEFDARSRTPLQVGFGRCLRALRALAEAGLELKPAILAMMRDVRSWDEMEETGLRLRAENPT